MKSHARVVVIGGGAMGVGLLYHLAKEGWNDAAGMYRRTRALSWA